MLIATAAGVTVDLRIVGYQYPGLSGSGAGYDFDANWLMVSGRVARPNGSSFRFQDPSLLTDEAVEMGRWLAAAARGECTPVDHWDWETKLPSGMLDFLEPNIAWSVQGLSQSDISLRLHLSAEAAPPEARPGYDRDFFQVLTLPRKGLAEAAAAWEAEAKAYPRR